MSDLWPTAADLGLPEDMVHINKAADIGPARSVASIVWDVVHCTEGFMANDEPYLAAPTDPVASCHALIGPDGLVVLMVPLNFTAWTPGNDTYAKKSINLEISGFASRGFTDAQYTSYAAYHRWAVRAGAKIAGTYIGRTGAASGILGHQDVPNPDKPGQFGGVSGHTDPGPKFDWVKFVNLCNGGGSVPAQQLPYGVTIDSAGALIFPINAASVPLNFGFKDAFLTLFGNVPQGDLSAAIMRGVKIFGLPVAPEVVVENGAEQEFEFCWFGYNRTEAPGWQIRLKKKSTFQAA